ncbi:MAG: type II secretion system F family protein [Pseudomonadota bacterium]|nr:type II secretion system F family protein [Pseudomonadota bacterium]
MTNKELSHFYKNFYELVESGIPINGILETLRTTSKGDHLKRQYGHALKLVDSGKTLTESLQSAELISPFDVEIIRAAESSGSLSRVLTALSFRYEVRSAAEQELRSGLWRPFFLFVAALFVPSLPGLMSGKTTLAQYCISSFGLLSLVLFLVYLIFKFNNLANQNYELALLRFQIFSKVPFISGLIKKMALENFCSSLAFMLDAGIDMFRALKWAGNSSADKSIKRSAQMILMQIKEGRDLAVSFRAQPAFTDEIKNAIFVGNQSGKIPTMLHRASQDLNRDVTSRVQAIAKFVPLIIYAVIAFFVAKQIIDFYSEHLKDIDKALGE